MARSAAVLALTAALLPAAAWAHTGIGAHGARPFAAGLAHPLFGPDHLLAMVAVGILAALTGGRARLAYPSVFVGAMLVGGAFGLAGVALPMVEPAILASVVVLGATIALAPRLPLVPACTAIALFGVAHGHAHGLEAPALGGLSYAAGFVLSTAALHGLGFLAGRRGAVLGRVLGGMTCVAGLALAAA